MKLNRWLTLVRLTILLGLTLLIGNEINAQALVPGTGTQVPEVGDDFEDPTWEYQLSLPKVFNNGETTVANNLPGGAASNGRWYEGSKRGQPDTMRRVVTPAGGLSGSTTALALRSLQTGSNRPTFQQQQDDLIASVSNRVGKIPVSQSPSVVTRVWFPPIDQWERRDGCHFAFRVAIETESGPIQSASYRGRNVTSMGESWPGFFVNLDYKQPAGATTAATAPRAYLWMKADQRGQQISGPEIKQTGWWTFGISLSPDGQVHYFAKPGIADLTAADHVASSYPHGQSTVQLRNFFFNVCNGDDGRTWSSEFVIDDPSLYVIR